MKNTIAALAIGLLLAGCQQKEEAAATDTTAEAKEPAAKTLIADKDKLAYAIGSDMANSIKRINEEYKAVTMDIEVVKQGFLETLKSGSTMSDEEIAQQMQVFQQKLRFAQQQKMQEMQAAKQAENTAFFEKVATEGYTKTESGLFYKVVEAGKEGAAKPSATDRVKVHYTGTFTNGEQFDSSVEREPFEFSLQGGVIQGWLEGVKLMTVGSKYHFVIPPELGYGSRGNPRIPAGSILEFDIELLEILPTASAKAEEKQ